MLTFAFHDKATIPARVVRKILVKEVGLAEGSEATLRWRAEWKTVRVIHHHEAEGWWAESLDVEGWTAVGDSYPEVVKLAEEGVPFALGHEAELEHYVPAGKHVAA